MSNDPRFPIGAPVNRPEPQVLKPIPGRPNWFQGKPGTPPVYIEPTPPPLPYAICARRSHGLSPAVLHAAAAVTRAKLNQLGACWRARSAAERGEG